MLSPFLFASCSVDSLAEMITSDVLSAVKRLSKSQCDQGGDLRLVIAQ